MKKILVFIFIFIFFITLVQGAYEGPSTKYCTHMGYEIKYIEDEEALYCVFDEINKCKFDDFWAGICGQEHVKEIPCRKEGEIVVIEHYQLFGGKTSLYEECCEGLIAAQEPGVFSTGDFLICFNPKDLKHKELIHTIKMPYYLFRTFLTDDDAKPFRIGLGIIILILIVFFIIKKYFKKNKSF